VHKLRAQLLTQTFARLTSSDVGTTVAVFRQRGSVTVTTTAVTSVTKQIARARRASSNAETAPDVFRQRLSVTEIVIAGITATKKTACARPISSDATTREDVFPHAMSVTVITIVETTATKQIAVPAGARPLDTFRRHQLTTLARPVSLDV